MWKEDFLVCFKLLPEVGHFPWIILHCYINCCGYSTKNKSWHCDFVGWRMGGRSQVMTYFGVPCSSVSESNSKLVSVSNTIKTCGRSRGNALHILNLNSRRSICNALYILNLSTRCSWVTSLTLWLPVTPRKQNPVPTH